MTTRGPRLSTVLWTTINREWLSHRVNRFLVWHLVLLVCIGLLAVATAPAGSERGIAWFLLNGVLYVLSLSSLLLGLSSAQAETEELSFLATQPMGLAPWVSGKALGLLALVGPSALLLVIPGLVASDSSRLLLLLAPAAGGLCSVFALLGLALGFWIQDPVRALITALAVWFVLLFGMDLVLLLTAGSPWIREHPIVWTLPLMLNPLGAFRITVMFAVEQAAFNPLGAGAVVSWWTRHTAAWLSGCLTLWIGGTWCVAILGLRHRRGRG